MNIEIEAQLAADEYLRNSARIRELENRQMYLLKFIKTLFDNEYGRSERNGILPTGKLHNQSNVPSGEAKRNSSF
jgi:hypothetical protein